MQQLAETQPAALHQMIQLAKSLTPPAPGIGLEIAKIVAPILAAILAGTILVKVTRAQLRHAALLHRDRAIRESIAAWATQILAFIEAQEALTDAHKRRQGRAALPPTAPEIRRVERCTARVNAAMVLAYTQARHEKLRQQLHNLNDLSFVTSQFAYDKEAGTVFEKTLRATAKLPEVRFKVLDLLRNLDALI